ncbi:four-carbon acid sugar kinase family protein [Nonomuraea polychroma]|uniref:four-carbon acid sugar kinase family protein n=1 Tax=Nonomuraea polychroma TaxID=46176 RepID=UPI000FDF32A6|nr:four-carbon acid sugar kinase family protein [Nonomuraea polychroma]
MSRRVIVLDDDPTGTQAAAGVPVLLDLDAALPDSGPCYVLTNSRALEEAEAVRLVRRLRARFGPAEYVLRGDSTLRGHVFAEADALGAADGVLLFVPAYPGIGRVTVGGVHYVVVSGRRVVAADTEFAADPVFGYTARTMAGWAMEVGGREATTVALDAVRRGDLAGIFRRAAPGSVVVPDVETDDDLAAISAALDDVTTAAGAGRLPVVLRCAAPLAALRAGRLAQGLLPALSPDAPPVQRPPPPRTRHRCGRPRRSYRHPSPARPSQAGTQDRRAAL